MKRGGTLSCYGLLRSEQGLQAAMDGDDGGGDECGDLEL